MNIQSVLFVKNGRYNTQDAQNEWLKKYIPKLKKCPKPSDSGRYTQYHLLACSDGDVKTKYKIKRIDKDVSFLMRNDVKKIKGKGFDDEDEEEEEEEDASEPRNRVTRTPQDPEPDQPQPRYPSQPTWDPSDPKKYKLHPQRQFQPPASPRPRSSITKLRILEEELKKHALDAVKNPRKNREIDPFYLEKIERELPEDQEEIRIIREEEENLKKQEADAIDFRLQTMAQYDAMRVVRNGYHSGPSFMISDPKHRKIYEKYLAHYIKKYKSEFKSKPNPDPKPKPKPGPDNGDDAGAEPDKDRQKRQTGKGKQNSLLKLILKQEFNTTSVKVALKKDPNNIINLIKKIRTEQQKYSMSSRQYATFENIISEIKNSI